MAVRIRRSADYPGLAPPVLDEGSWSERAAAPPGGSSGSSSAVIIRCGSWSTR